MSGLPDTFPCPWCGMSYPAKPVLVGRSVRCKGCRNGFVLQADGIATKIEDQPSATVSTVSAAASPPSSPAVSASVPPPAAVPAAPSKPTPPAPITPPPVKPTPSTPAPIRPPPSSPAPAVRPSAPTPPLRVEALAELVVEDVVVLPKSRPEAKTETAAPAKSSERVPKRKTEHLAAARAQMAAQLADVAAKAANSEVAKREERRSERLAKAVSGTPAGDPVRTSRSAILTGEGERYHRERRMLWMWLGVAAAIGLLILLVMSMRSSTRSTLDRYAAPVAADQNRYPLLGDVLRSRAWLASALSMPGGPVLATDLSDASFAAERSIAVAPLQGQLAELKGMRLDTTLGLWLAPADLDKARGAAGNHAGAEASKILMPAKIRHAVHSQVLQKLALSDDDATIVLDLLTGTPPRDGEAISKRILDLGELPDAIVVRPFSGRRGDLLIDIGRPPYRSVQGPYTGAILRFEGSRWPIGWRVLHLNQSK